MFGLYIFIYTYTKDAHIKGLKYIMSTNGCLYTKQFTNVLTYVRESPPMWEKTYNKWFRNGTLHHLHRERTWPVLLLLSHALDALMSSNRM